MQTLWQTEGDNLKRAARQFAEEYWAQPRKVRDFKVLADGATFGVENGSRWYRAEFARGTYGTLVVVKAPEVE
jgi:hypothetical protein